MDTDVFKHLASSLQSEGEKLVQACAELENQPRPDLRKIDDLAECLQGIQAISEMMESSQMLPQMVESEKYEIRDNKIGEIYDQFMKSNQGLPMY